MATCPTDEEIADLVEGVLDEAVRRSVTEHLGDCDACRLLVAAAQSPMPDARVPDAESKIAAGTRLGRFVVLELVGKGGMGAVYAAYDPELDRKVALKVVRSVSHAAHLEERLKREAQALARLNHPNVITIYEVGSVGAQLFIAMEFVEAGTLRQWLKAETRGWREIVAHFCFAGEGLAAAHAVGLVHRDFKPDNVLVGRDGRMRVTDFGLARATAGDDVLPFGAVAPESPLNESITAAGALVGTPAYMAPEQLDGEPLDGRADQFSFCASLYQALYGELPFTGDNRRAIRAAIAVESVRLPPRKATVPPRVRAVLLRGLRSRPEERYRSMRQLVDALRAAQHGRGRRYASVSAVAVCVLVGVLFGLRGRHAPPPWRAEVRSLGPAYDENSDWVDISPDGKSLAYTSDRDGSWRVYVGPLRGDSARAVTPQGHSLVIFPRWTRDGAAILYSEQALNATEGDNSALVIKRLTLANGQIDDLARGAAEADDCGGQLVLLENESPDCPNCPRIVTRSGGVEHEIFRGLPATAASNMRCDRTGTRVAFVAVSSMPGKSPMPAIWLLGTDGSGLRPIVTDSDGGYPFFHPDGRSLVYARFRGAERQIWEQPLAGGAPQRLTDGTLDTAPVVSPDGRLLVFNEDSTSFPMFAFADGKQQRLTHTLLEVLLEPVATHDGRELIMWSANRDRLVRLVLADGSQEVLSEGRTPAVAPDDRVLYFTRVEHAGGSVLSMPRGGGPVRLLTRLPNTPEALSFGGDGALHLTLSTPAGHEAWRVALDGTLAREAPAPYRIVLPAPTGGWCVAGLDLAGKHWLELIPPGGVVGRAGNKRLPVFPWAWDTTGTSLIGSDDENYVRVGIDGSVHRLFARGEVVLGAAVSPDGKTVYTNVKVARVRRQVVVNYDERPRPR
jgi:serine/threonine protein kinase